MTNKNTKYWLIIEGYVHISIKSKKVLLYNTLSGEILRYNNHDKIIDIIQKIVHKSNQYVLKLDFNELHNQIVINFIEDIREKFMGDIIETNLSSKRPIAFYPIFNINQDRTGLESDNFTSDGENILTSLNELTLYVNSYKKNGLSKYEGAYKQILYPYFNNREESFNYKLLQSFLEEINYSSIYNVNLLGGNLLDYENTKELLEFFSKQTYWKTIIIRLLDLVDNDNKKVHPNLQFIFNLNDSFTINCIVDSFENQEENIRLIELSKKVSEKIEYVFIVSNENQLNEIENIRNITSIEKYRVIPFYNRNNLDFFEKFVYMDEQDILENKTSLEMIFSNQVMNRNHFGKLTILSNGEIFTNINDSCKGNIKTGSLKKIIYDEMMTGNSWKNNRTKISPCKNCNYELLCPSISNYEYVIKKMNLCKIVE